MPKKVTTISIDRDLWDQAKSEGLNISKFVEEALIDFLTKKEVYDESLPGMIAEELEKYAEIARVRDGWEKFAAVRCRMIRDKYGLVIQPHKLIYLVSEKLKQGGDEE